MVLMTLLEIAWLKDNVNLLFKSILVLNSKNLQLYSVFVYASLLEHIHLSCC